MRDEFYFPSKDGNTEIHTIEWKPEGEVKAVLQLSHGMVDYIKRYEEFAEFMSRHGYYVVGNDHLGHGKSVQSKSEYGFFNEKYEKCQKYRHSQKRGFKALRSTFVQSDIFPLFESDRAFH